MQVDSILFHGDHVGREKRSESLRWATTKMAQNKYDVYA